MNGWFTFHGQHATATKTALPPAMHSISLPLVQSYFPTTFLERGVAVPFTTPMLSGARARPAQRGGAELIVSSPGGGRGVYILTWGNVREFCRPTMHDVRLNQQIETISSVTPSTIRAAARQVAAQGLAGREMLDAVGNATKAEEQEALLSNFQLLMALVEQTEPGNGAAADPSVLEAKAKRATGELALRLGRAPEAVAAALEEMAPVFA